MSYFTCIFHGSALFVQKAACFVRYPEATSGKTATLSALGKSFLRPNSGASWFGVAGRWETRRCPGHIHRYTMTHFAVATIFIITNYCLAFSHRLSTMSMFDGSAGIQSMEQPPYLIYYDYEQVR